MLLTGGGEDGRASVKRWRIKVGKKRKLLNACRSCWLVGGLGGCLSDPRGAAERVDELMDPYALVNRKHCKHDKPSRTRGGEEEERRFTTSLKRVTIKSDGIYKGLGGGVREVVVVGGGSMTSPVTAGAAQPYMQTHVLSDSAIKPLTRSKSSNHSKPFSGCQ